MNAGACEVVDVERSLEEKTWAPPLELVTRGLDDASANAIDRAQIARTYAPTVRRVRAGGSFR